MNDTATKSESAANASQRPTAVAHSWGVLLAYGAPAMPMVLAEVPILLYLPAFYAREMDLKPTWVGLIFLSVRLWDGLFDMLVGWLSDRSRSRFGRRKPWIVLAAPCLMFSTWYLCNPPPNAGLLYLGIWAALFYSAHTSMKIPHISMGTELASDYFERSRVASSREIFNILGSLFFAAAPLLFLAANAPLHEVLWLISIVVLWLVPLTVLPLALCVRDSALATHHKPYLLKRLVALAKDRALVRFLVAKLFIELSNGITNTLAVFSFGVGLRLPDKLFWVILTFYLGTLAVLPATLRLAKRVEKHHLMAVGTAIYMVAVGSLMFAPDGQFTIVLSLWVVAAIGYAAMLVLPTSMLADIIDNSELQAKERHSGAYVAVYNLLWKVGLALGVGLGLGLLDLVNYDPAASSHSAVDVRNIRVLGFGLPALLLVPAIVLLWKHPITRKVQRHLRAEIDARTSTTQS